MFAHLKVFFKGMLMGAADIVPGVSGGTIAFITGIYERLINAIKSMLPAFFSLLKERQLVAFWQQIDGHFLLVLVAGILASVLSLASLITYLLSAHPIPLWAFFFGLILASVWAVGKQLPRVNLPVLSALCIGFIFAWLLTGITPGQAEATTLNVFFSGYIAICAMILPGISGSFILLMLGSYELVLSAIKNFDIALLSVFAGGCLCGLLSIANLLAWALRRFHAATLALLIGFMLGALNKVWPWKEVLETRINSKGEQVALVEQNISPMHYESLTGQPSLLVLALGFALIGALMVLILDRVGNTKDAGSSQGV